MFRHKILPSPEGSHTKLEIATTLDCSSSHSIIQDYTRCWSQKILTHYFFGAFVRLRKASI